MWAKLKSSQIQVLIFMPDVEGNAIRVFVDAKIKGMHNRESPKTAYVGYLVEGLNLHHAKQVDADQTDDAEIQAILFAIEELGPKYGRVTVICDHQSVVSEAKRQSVKRPSLLMEKLRKTLKENPQISLEALTSNLARKVVTEYVNGLK